MEKMKNLINKTTIDLLSQKKIIDELILKINDDIGKKNIEFANIDSKINIYHNKYYKLETESTKMKLLIPKLKVTIDHLEKEILTKQKESDRFNDIVSDIHNTESKKLDLDNKIIALNELNSVCKKEYLDIQEKLKQSHKEIHKINEEKAIINMEILSMKKDHVNSSAVIKHINAQIEATNNELVELKQKSQDKEDEITKIEDKKTETIKQMDEVIMSKQKSKEELNNINQSIQDAETQLLEINSKFDIERARLKSEESRIIALKKEVLNLIINNRVGNNNKNILKFVQENQDDKRH